MGEVYSVSQDPIEGWVDGCVQGVVRGWARRLGADGQPVVVEILVEGTVVGEGVARLQRADLDVAGKGACAFEIAVDVGGLETPVAEAVGRVKTGEVLPGGGVSIDVAALKARQVATGGRQLSLLPVPFGGEAGLGGFLDEFGPDRIFGWIFNPTDPSPPIAFEIWEAEKKLATVTADVWRVDLEEMRQGDGRWGFAAPVPPALQDDAVHEIDIRLVTAGRSALAEPLRFHLPRRSGPAPAPAPPPRQDAEAIGSAYTRPLCRTAPSEPLFSIIVNFYNMQREAARTLTSLSRCYQRDIGDLRYEVLCIDNGSNPPLDPDWVRSFGPEFRLIQPSQVLSSPCAAINEVARMATGRYLAIMIDGAYVLTPGVFRATWDALEEAPQGVVALRQWFVGGDQRWLAKVGYTRRQEDILFDKIAWPEDGYQLFKIGMSARESPNNWFDGMIESNCLFLPAALYQDIGGMNESFSEAGAGFANLDLFKRAAEASGEPVIALLGEASFHQFHGGTTTNIPLEEMERRVRSYDETYFQVVGKKFLGLEPVDLHMRGQFRIGYGISGRHKPASPARIGVTDRVRDGVLPLHFDDRATAYVQSAYIECGLHHGTKWQGRKLSIAPADVLNIQDIVHQTRPGRIVAVNAEPGMLVLLDSLLRLSDRDDARIVSVGGIDPPSPWPVRVDRIAGNPLAPEALAATARALDAEEQVLVLFAPADGDHFPIDALRAYSRFVSCRSYLIFLGSAFGQPWLGYSKNWFQKAIRILAGEGRFAIDYSRDQHLITTCPMGYLQRTGGFVSLDDGDDDEPALASTDL
jgi:cephalosporin hydroxylase/glycosyltransferase involved in cell wall biosynthesis